MLEKPLGSVGLSGTTIKVMIENILTMRFVSKHIYLDIFILGTGFLENVKIMLIDKTDGQNPKKREDHRRKTFKTYAPFRPNGQCLSMFYNFWTLYICVASSIALTF